MIVVNLSGGIGNQLFQYAFAMLLEEQFGQKVIFSDCSYSYDLIRRSELEILYPKYPRYNNQWLFTCHRSIKYRLTKLIFILNPFTNLFTDANFDINDISQRKLNHRQLNYFTGHWQTDKIVLRLTKAKEYFIPKTEKPKLIRKYESDILNTNSVSVHIRRGDYFLPDNIKRYGVCTAKYYNNAIEYLELKVDNPVLYIFTDDILWVKSNLKFSYKTIFVENININNYWYIYLMSKCNHNIISNSSFSWWGAYLNENSKKLVIAPKKWMLNSDHSIALNTWIKV